MKGRQHKLVYLDTNVLSEASKRLTPERQSLVELFATGGVFLCYSVFSIMEIMEKPKLYEAYIELFGLLPSIVLKGYEQIIEDEISLYPNPSDLSPTLISSWGIRSPDISDPRDKLRKVIELSNLDLARKKWNNDKPEILDGMLSLVENAKDLTAREFVEQANYQFLDRLHPNFIASLNRKGQSLNIDAFPSLKMMGFTVFHRFYVENRKPVLSDVFDIIMSTVFPYCDMVYIERYQAEVMRKTRRIDNFIDNVEVRTLADLR